MEYQVRQLLKATSVDSAALLADIAICTDGTGHVASSQAYNPAGPYHLDPLLYAEVLLARGEYLHSLKYLGHASDIMSDLESAWQADDVNAEVVYAVSKPILCPTCNTDMYKPSHQHLIAAMCPVCHEITDVHTYPRRVQILVRQLECYMRLSRSNDIFVLLTSYGCMSEDSKPSPPHFAALPSSTLHSLVKHFLAQPLVDASRDVCVVALQTLVERNPLDVCALMQLAELSHPVARMESLYSQPISLHVPVLVARVVETPVENVAATATTPMAKRAKTHHNGVDASSPASLGAASPVSLTSSPTMLYASASTSAPPSARSRSSARRGRRSLPLREPLSPTEPAPVLRDVEEEKTDGASPSPSLTCLDQSVFVEWHPTEALCDTDGGASAPTLAATASIVFNIAACVATFNHLLALPLLQSFQAMFPRSAAVAALCVSVQFQAQDGDDAFRRMWTHALQQQPEAVSGMDRLAFYLHKRDLKKQLSLLAPALARCAPNRPETLVAAALLADSEDDKEKALQQAERALMGDVRHVCSWLVKAWLLVKAEKYPEAISTYMRARSLIGSARDLSIEAGLCNALLLDNQHNSALSVAVNALRLAPRNPKALTLAGAVLMCQPDALGVEKARKAFLKALSLDPTCTEAAMHLSKLQSREGRTREALALMESVVAVNSNEVAHTQLGTLYAAERNLQKASEHFHVALQLAPGYPAALSGLDELGACTDMHEEDLRRGRLDMSLNDTDIMY